MTRRPGDAAGVDAAYSDRFRGLAELTDRFALGNARALASLETALSDGPLHPQAVRALAVAFGRGWSTGRLQRMAHAICADAKPIGTVAVIAPGNLFVAAWQAVLEPWLAGNRVRVRPSADDCGAIAWLVAQLAALTPQAAAIVLDPWPRGDAEASRHFFATADAMALWGGDLALADLRQQAAAVGFTGPLRLHGPRTALAVIDATGPLPDRIFAGLARDVVVGDGRGCMGVGRVWWLGADAAGAAAAHDRLAHQLRSAADQWPPGPACRSVQAATWQRGQALAVVAELTAGSHFSARPDGWSFTGADVNALRPIGDPPGRCVVTAAIPNVALQGGLAAWKGKLSVVVTNLPTADARDLARDLGCRWCRPGQAQAPRADQGHDGYHVFEGLLRTQ